jgi:hypothetical protein
MYIGHVKYLLLSSDLTKTGISQQTWIKILNTKFHENPNYGTNAVP